MMVAIITLAVHGLVQPYVNPDDNLVQLLILCNQCIVVLCFIMVRYLTNDNATFAAGAFLMGMQRLLYAVIVYYVAGNMLNAHKALGTNVEIHMQQNISWNGCHQNSNSEEVGDARPLCVDDVTLGQPSSAEDVDSIVMESTTASDTANPIKYAFADTREETVY
ncbi:hypothetical protein CYMTET_6333 [Cymbomonas tetramitiformis]|uniref:Uncharacterized protein n=1 Tax=Cymbomonas tetramitiformis TaxID=36881 RepID=A0AAE0GXA5_9CHLO|nr:hypothetical protein CYMTET_46475 [Cymbomonas tetramitiformis]KAK3286090.1 hypothetical protein CYMTET_6333 [Cymbomonas tetramitiformis]